MKFLDLLTIVGFFLLRIGIPLLITFGVGYFLRRLDARWEMEARQEGMQPQPQSQPRPRPAQPRPVIPSILPQPLAAAAGAGAGVDQFHQPCWDLRDCDPELMQTCPAALHPEIPCWLARREMEGKIPEACYHCVLFTAAAAALPTEGAELFQ